MLLEIERVGGHYGAIKVLDEIDIAVADGEIVALVGANGAGKTTLLRILSGLHRASSGTVTFIGENITRCPASRRVRRGIAHVPEGRQVFSPMTIEDNLKMGGHTRPSTEVLSGIERAYAMFPVLAERRRQLAGTLSGGEQQMLAIARALMSRPRVLLLDEPSMGLAPFMVEAIMETVERLRSEGVTILLVEQNAVAALRLADRGYVIESGRIKLKGTGAGLLADQRVRDAYLGTSPAIDETSVLAN